MGVSLIDGVGSSGVSGDGVGGSGVEGFTGATKHAYWRIYITDSHSVDTYAIQIATLQFRASVGGDPQAVGGSAIASASFGDPPNPGSPPMAFDTDISTLWTTKENVAAPWWLGYQHAEEVVVKEVMVQVGDNATRATRAPIDFEIQYSDDGSTWTTALTVTGEAAWGVSEIRTYEVS